jgi:Fe2+ transport protein
LMIAVSIAAISTSCATSNRKVAPAPEPEPAEVHAILTEPITPPVMPPFRESDEATSAQLGRALDEGKSARREVEWVEREEAVASGDMDAGEYIVTYLITPADDYYDLEAAQSNLPAHHTTVSPGSAHVAIVVRDAADGRMVQGLNVLATLRSESGDAKQTVMLPFGWHPILNRYGKNVVLPASPFTLSVRIAMPTYRRHDRINGDRFTSNVIARFTRVTVPVDSLAAAAERLARGELRQAVDLARDEGEAVDRPLTALIAGPDASGSQVRSGDYKVAVVVQQDRGYWEARNGKLSYVNPDSSVGPTVHIDVIVRDATTGRFVPGLRLRATILNSRKKEIDTYTLPFMWHPWMNHYGLTVPTPGKGRYTIRVRAEAPDFRRYGNTALKKFNRAIDVSVRGVRMRM